MTTPSLPPLPNVNRSSFYYYISHENKGIFSGLYDEFVDCLGYIGDVISYILYKESEYCGWRIRDLKRDMLKLDFIHDVSEDNNIIITIPTNDSSQKIKLEEAIKRISINWDLNCTIIPDPDLIFISIPTSKFIATKWKVQGMMQVLRALYTNQKVIDKGKITINNQNCIKYTIVGMYTETLSWIFTLSFVNIDDTLHFTEKSNIKLYPNRSKIIDYSHTIGVIELTPHLIEHYVPENT